MAQFILIQLESASSRAVPRKNIQVNNHRQKHGDLETKSFARRNRHPDAQNDKNAHTNNWQEKGQLIKSDVTSYGKSYFLRFSHNFHYQHL